MNVRNVKNSQRAGMHPCSGGGLSWSFEWTFLLKYWVRLSINKAPQRKACFHTSVHVSFIFMCDICVWPIKQLEVGECLYQQDMAKWCVWNSVRDDVFNACAISKLWAYCTNGLCNNNKVREITDVVAGLKTCWTVYKETNFNVCSVIVCRSGAGPSISYLSGSTFKLRMWYWKKVLKPLHLKHSE